MMQSNDYGRSTLRQTTDCSMLDTFVTTTFIKTEMNNNNNDVDDPETILKDLYKQEPMLLSQQNFSQ